MPTTSEAATMTQGPNIWIGDEGNDIDPSWMEQQKILSGSSIQILKCEAIDVSNLGRKAKDGNAREGATLKVSVHYKMTKPQESINRNKIKTLILKQIPPSGKPLAKRLGLAREALFYNELAPRVSSSVTNDNNHITPKTYFSWGNMETGEKMVLMEDLSADMIDSGVLFGPGNPNNWSRDLPAMIQASFPKPDTLPPPTAAQVTKNTFMAIAKVHAHFWNNHTLFCKEDSWLRGSDWIQGQGQASWEASQSIIQDIWKRPAVQERVQTQWDPIVKSIIEASMKQISWGHYLKCLSERKHFTLVHGDFWPGNIMISTKDPDQIQIIDWEMVGLGSGPQDLGQYVLSNMEPSERRACEHDILREYYNELTRLGVENWSWEECWKEYRLGGLERWIWFLVYFNGQEGPLLDWAKFFHDQVAAFVKDHDIKPEEIGPPRT